jgi:hypothetical protein
MTFLSFQQLTKEIDNNSIMSIFVTYPNEHFPTNPWQYSHTYMFILNTLYLTEHPILLY